MTQTLTLKTELKNTDFEIIKLKFIDEEDFLLYLDWLFRFKSPIFNKTRVYEKIITKNLIYPKINLKKIKSLDFLTIAKIASEIWNKSLENLGLKPFLNDLTNYMITEETKIFSAKKLLEELLASSSSSLTIAKTKELLSQTGFSVNKHTKDYDKLYFEISGQYCLNIDEIVKYFIKNKKTDEKISRLTGIFKIMTSKKHNSEILFKNLINTNFSPIKILFLAEGITEQTLFPVFAEKFGYNFTKNGIKMIVPGGKNPILKFYTEIKDKLNIPVFILLDADGVDVKPSIEKILHKKDKLYLLKNGEIEDTLDKKLILKSINNFYQTSPKISIKEIDKECSTTKLLTELWKEKGLGDFNKAHFAQLIAQNINKNNISPEISIILNKLKEMKSNN